MAASIEGTPTDMCPTTFLQAEWALRQCGPASGGLWHQRRILGVVAESALTMMESRVMILTPEGDVEDASGQGREIEGIRWSEDRALPSGIRRERACAFRREVGDVQLRRAGEAAEVEARADSDRRHPGILHPVDGAWWSLARLQALPLQRYPLPVAARGEGDWRVLETVGDMINTKDVNGTFKRQEEK